MEHIFRAAHITAASIRCSQAFPGFAPKIPKKSRRSGESPYTTLKSAVPLQSSRFPLLDPAIFSKLCSKIGPEDLPKGSNC